MPSHACKARMDPWQEQTILMIVLNCDVVRSRPLWTSGPHVLPPSFLVHSEKLIGMEGNGMEVPFRQGIHGKPIDKVTFECGPEEIEGMSLVGGWEESSRLSAQTLRLALD